MAEIELKLEMDDIAIESLLTADVLLGVPAFSSQHDIYYDTPAHDLRTSGFSLRVRHSGGEFIQAVKSTHSGSSDIYARGEWEMRLEDDRPVIDHSTPLAALGVNVNELARQFDVKVERRRWLVTQEGSDIEVAVDRGQVSAGDRHSSISEIELELKDGQAAMLFTMARRVSAISPFRIGVLSKSERGYLLIEPLKTAHKAEPVKLHKSMSAAAAFQVIAAACFRQFRLNETILLQRREPEALHQTRVAVRRLRSAFVVFKPILREGEAAKLSDELRWLASILGNARDIDVLLARADHGDLRGKLRTARDAAYDEVLEALQSSRAASLFIDFNEWLRCGSHLEQHPSGDELLSVTDFATKALDRMRKKLKKHGEALGETDDEHRHQVRKDAKKFRYSAEFFASLFTGKKCSRRHARFVIAMEELQDQLGVLNDLVSAPSILEKFGLDDHPDVGTLLPDASKTTLIEDAQSALDDVADLKRFWR